MTSSCPANRGRANHDAFRLCNCVNLQFNCPFKKKKKRWVIELSEKHQNWFVLKAEKLSTRSWKKNVMTMIVIMSMIITNGDGGKKN